MSDAYISRTLEPVIRRASNEFPAVVLTGPRQSGKTTLLKYMFGEDYRYVSLEPPDIRLSANEDPRAFLEGYPPPVILDEVQYAPDLLPYIKEKIDDERQKTGQYILTGSQNLLLMERVTESLAGRAAILKLLPLSRREAEHRSQAMLPWESKKPLSPADNASYGLLWNYFLRGGYPELAINPDRDISLWHASYIQTYIERDVRMLRQVGDLGQFQSFLRALAVRSAQLLNLTELSRDLGISVNTVKSWISILEASYQIVILRPYFVNIGKRLIKTPKIYFTDTGTLCYLTGLKDPGHAAAGPMGGAIMETAVVMELFKSILHRGVEPELWFWRTSTGEEVDILLKTEGSLIPLEVKLNATPHPKMATGIRGFRNALGPSALPGYLVHPGDRRFPLAQGVTALPFSEL